MRHVGYLLNTKKRLEGEPGIFYNYILAGNGLFIRAEGPLLSATICIASAQVRGLSALTEEVTLKKGKIPRHVYGLALAVAAARPYHERYLAVTWEGEYRLRQPWQDGDFAGVYYESLPNTVLDIHSHGAMGAFFSSTDNTDEQGLRLYMVVGRLDTLTPEVLVRVGIYGYFALVEIDQIFG